MYLHSIPVKMAAAASKAVFNYRNVAGIGTASSKVPDIERGDLEQALKKAPLFFLFLRVFGRTMES